MTNNFDLAAWHIQTLTGSADTVCDFRCIHDKRKDLPAHNYRGSLAEMWSTLQKYNADGYGIFVNVNAMRAPADPKERRTLDHVEFIRAHLVDLDSVTAVADFQRATADGASFVVQTSPNKFHVYFRVQPYVGNEFYTLQQRKLAQFYNGDPSVIDATRIIRAAGFLHLKREPFLVTGWGLPAFDRLWSSDEIAAHVQHVNVIEHFSTRSPLGTPELQAPSFEWLRFALSLLDPNDLDRAEWLSISAAVKQAGFNLADPAVLFGLWSDWCAQYAHNDAGENLKLWDSVKETEVGWTTLERRSPVKAYMMFGFKDAPAPRPMLPAPSPPAETTQVAPAPVQTDTSGEILSDYECRDWFKDCYFVEQAGKIYSHSGRFMNATQFNGRYGGKQFIITSTGKLTDEPWKAALRSTCWQIPKVDHIRFLPERPTFEIVNDALGRRGLNTFIPAKIDSREGDVSMWLDHVARILPNEGDRRILFEYMAHCVKFKGHKIPWAVVLQSAEGIGKTVFFEVMAHALGEMYVYTPKADQLVSSGNVFNSWMRNKLLIVVNEIKIDERRELIEILKPMITEARVEVQSKGVDQDMEDNAANWLMFSNYKDAVPIKKNGRRYSVFYSALQSKADILAAGMDDAYFNRLWPWLREGGGLQAIAHWLMNYPIERGGIPVRAPETSSHAEAISVSRSPMETVIADCITDGVTGFRGGYISSIAVVNRVKAAGIKPPSARSVQSCIEEMGFVPIGRAHRAHIQEDINNRAEIYGNSSHLLLENYGRAQGYE